MKSGKLLLLVYIAVFAASSRRACGGTEPWKECRDHCLASVAVDKTLWRSGEIIRVTVSNDSTSDIWINVSVDGWHEGRWVDVYSSLNSPSKDPSDPLLMVVAPMRLQPGKKVVFNHDPEKELHAEVDGRRVKLIAKRRIQVRISDSKGPAERIFSEPISDTEAR